MQLIKSFDAQLRAWWLEWGEMRSWECERDFFAVDMILHFAIYLWFRLRLRLMIDSIFISFHFIITSLSSQLTLSISHKPSTLHPNSCRLLLQLRSPRAQLFRAPKRSRIVTLPPLWLFPQFPFRFLLLSQHILLFLQSPQCRTQMCDSC